MRLCDAKPWPREQGEWPAEEKRFMNVNTFCVSEFRDRGQTDEARHPHLQSLPVTFTFAEGVS